MAELINSGGETGGFRVQRYGAGLVRKIQDRTALSPMYPIGPSVQVRKSSLSKEPAYRSTSLPSLSL